ncbi:TetR/AcrR family transcriptional regulator [Lysobacter korlensis]|uniref:TetR/AcrR family transcriptional regulator n=2 Tax=Lysobacter korlensis TaxID=553636 RepID=A0ABV6RXB5_9GAMM
MEIPHVVRLAWGRTDGRQAGRQPSLTLRQILDAAIHLADTGGLEECSMPKLASDLGVGTMSLYRYVRNKSDLIVLMRDTAIGPLPPSSPERDDWDAALRFYATGMASRLLLHPWVLDIPVSGFPQTPNVLSWLELGLSALSAAGVGPQQQLGFMLLLDGHVNSTARLIRGAAPASQSASAPPRAFIDPEVYPVLTDLIDSGALEHDDFEDFGMSFGTEVIIGSVRAAIR